jgi:hypothetical protein|nr:MAG TPA: hypothetical protein [Caudoviricetes sp.]
MKRTYSEIRKDTEFNVKVMEEYYTYLDQYYLFSLFKGNYKFVDSENILITDESMIADCVFGVICTDNPIIEILMYFETVTDGEIRRIGHTIKIDI